MASSGIRALSSAFARSWSRKAERVAQKRPANSAHALDSAHVDDPNRIDPRPRRLEAIGPRGLAGLNAAPEPALGGDQKVLVERVGGDGHLDPFAPAGDDRERRRSGVGHPHVVLQLGHVLLGRRFFGERPGQHELGLEHRVGVLDHAVEGCGHPAIDRVLNPALDVGDDPPRVALVPGPVERLGGDAELDDEIVAQILRLGLAALFLPQPDQRRLVRAHDDPGVGAADEAAAVDATGIRTLVPSHDPLHEIAFQSK